MLWLRFGLWFRFRLRLGFGLRFRLGGRLVEHDLSRRRLFAVLVRRRPVLLASRASGEKSDRE